VDQTFGMNSGTTVNVDLLEVINKREILSTVRQMRIVINSGERLKADGPAICPARNNGRIILVKGESVTVAHIDIRG